MHVAHVPLALPVLAGEVYPVPDSRFGDLGAVQVVALVVCFVIPLIAWALLFRQVGRFVVLYRLGRPDAGRTGDAAARTWTLAKEFLGPHADEPAQGGRGGALVHGAGLHHPVHDARQRLLPARAGRLQAAGHRALPAVRVGRRDLRLGRARRHRRAHRDPAAAAPALGAGRGRSPVALLRVELLAGLLRRGDDLLRHHLHPPAARPRGGDRGAARAGHLAGAALPAHRVDGRVLVRASRCRVWRRGCTSSRPSRSSSRSPG